MTSLIRIANDRDREIVTWLRATLGDERVNAAVARLTRGDRPPYVSAVCRYLGVQLPGFGFARTVRDHRVGDEHLARMRAQLAKVTARSRGRNG